MISGGGTSELGVFGRELAVARQVGADVVGVLRAPFLDCLGRQAVGMICPADKALRQHSLCAGICGRQFLTGLRTL